MGIIERWHSSGALITKHGQSGLSCLRYSSVPFLPLCINGALECSWALRTPYPHHCCVKRGSLILSGLQIHLWGPDCVETDKPMHRRLTGPLSEFHTHHTHTPPVTHAWTHAHFWEAANATAVTGERCSLLQTKKGIVRIVFLSHTVVESVASCVYISKRGNSCIGRLRIAMCINKDCKQLGKMWIFHFTLHFTALNKEAEVKWECVPSFKLSSFTVRLFASWLLRCGRANLTKWKQQPPLVSRSWAGENSSLIVALLLCSPLPASYIIPKWQTHSVILGDPQNCRSQ